MQFFDYGEQDFVMCEMCQQDRAVDIHHLTKQSKFGNKKEKDYMMSLKRQQKIEKMALYGT